MFAWTVERMTLANHDPVGNAPRDSMQPPQLLIVGRPLDWIVERLEKRFAVTVLPDGVGDLSLEDAAETALVANFGGGVMDASAIARLPKLRGIVNFGVGYDRVDIAEAMRRGIPVGYLPGTTAACVADHAMAILLALMRRIVPAHAFVTRGEWVERRFPLTSRVTGRRLGIYGLGAIGAAAAKRAAGFDMPIGYHNRSARTDVSYRYFPTLTSLAEWAEILLVACPATAQTLGSVNALVLEALGPAGVLVNIARGSIVDEAALIAALDSRAIAGAALDVFATEPARQDQFAERENLVLTPHIAGGTNETWRDTVDLLEANLIAVVETSAVLNPVPGTHAAGGPARS
jgi:hydroxypyruvate reductase